MPDKQSKIFLKKITQNSESIIKEYQLFHKTVFKKQKTAEGRYYTVCGINLSKIQKNNYHFPLFKRLNHIFWHFYGQKKDRRLIEKNKDAKILVILHLYYAKAWPLIAAYLKNLAPYNCHLIVTYVKENMDAESCQKIKALYPSAELLPYENKGFDIGPFIDVLQKVDLSSYDIVIKLHSKGTKRPFIFIYDQIFKKKDWFFNLLDGVLSGKHVHQMIDSLLHSKTLGLAAAANLIVKDPLHKQYFTKKEAQKLGIKIKEDYQFVAGTVFAVKSQLLLPIQALKLSINDFSQTKRGDFSLAHAMERIICAVIEPAGFHFLKINAPHNSYAMKRQRLSRRSALKLLNDSRIELDYDFFYKSLETRPIKSYTIENIKLKDIKRKWFDGKVYSLNECSPYKYLKGNTKAYEEYCEINAKQTYFKSMSASRYNTLIASVQNHYDKKKMPVINADNNILLDGQHRCCILLDKYGEDYEIPVLAIKF